MIDAGSSDGVAFCVSGNAMMSVGDS